METMTQMERIGEKFRAKGVTQAQISKMTGMHYSRVSRIVTGKEKYASKKAMDKIETYLDGLNTDVA